MWMTPPSGMCDQHLLGEHVEIHMFLGSMAKGVSMQGYCDKGLMEPLALISRHDDLVREMERRGMRHKSPLPVASVEALISGLPRDQRDSVVDAEAALDELHRRCHKCKEGWR